MRFRRWKMRTRGVHAQPCSFRKLCRDTGGLGLGLNEQLSISIGRIPLCLHIPEKTLLEKAHERYGQFLHASPEALPIFLRAAGDINIPCVPRPAGAPDFSYNWNESSLLWEGAAAHFVGVRHEYDMDSLIRILLSVLLVPRHGFLLHAATVLRDDRAYVFTGHSGAGKSTVASMSPAGSVLTDEISLLRAVEGRWHAHGTPFWGEFRAKGANVHAPIKGVFVLVQAQEDRAERIPARDAIRAILPNVLFFSRDPDTTGGLLRLLAELLQQAPCYRLFFRKQPGFWAVIS